MAHLQPAQIGIPRKLFTEPNCRFCWEVGDGKERRIEMERRWKPRCRGGRTSGRNGFVSVSSTDQGMSVLEKTDGGEISSDCEEGVDEEQFYLVEEHGWKVRRMVEEEREIRKVAEIQAEAFHEPVALFNELFFQFFKAEVLSGLLYRLRNSPSDRYACLVAVPTSNPSKARDELVGVVDCTVFRDPDVLRHLPGAEEYLYVSGIAVSSSHRRKKVATALLKACELVSVLWGHEYLALRAYEDDRGARALYTNAGYRVVSGDSPWVALAGRKRRILMIKKLSYNFAG